MKEKKRETKREKIIKNVHAHMNQYMHIDDEYL